MGSFFCRSVAQGRYAAIQTKLKPRKAAKEDIIRQMLQYVSGNFRDNITLLSAAESLG